MIDSVKGPKRIAAKLMHFDGAYLRFVGAVEISRYRGAELVETYTDDAIWELMYFGHARDVFQPGWEAALRRRSRDDPPPASGG